MLSSAKVEVNPDFGLNEVRISRRNLIDIFNHYLAIVQADTKELLDSVFRLRFQVYCVERGFEDAAGYPEGRERDDDDARSLHFLVLDRSTGAPVGTVRLILPRVDADLPVFRLLRPGERRGVVLPRGTTAEVSRFAVAKSFRRRLQKDLGGSRPMLPLLTFGLIRAVAMMTLAGGVTHIVAMMEPALLRMLGRLGIEFHLIGEPVEHHGTRQPGWAAMAHLADKVRQSHPGLWELATDGGRSAPRLQPASAYG
jgi:N-acyl amino acid synthase of PEP-CTERM/exosortase system